MFIVLTFSDRQLGLIISEFVDNWADAGTTVDAQAFDKDFSNVLAKWTDVKQRIH